MDIRGLTKEELRAIATRNLADCCDACRAVLREQLEREELSPLETGADAL